VPENNQNTKFWGDVAQKIIAGLVLGLALGFANYQFWQKQEEYKKLSERIDQRIKIYTELSPALYRFIDSHNASSFIYRRSSCDAQCLKEKEYLDKDKKAAASKVSEILYMAEVYFPNGQNMNTNIRRLIFKSYAEPAVQITAKHEIFTTFKSALASFGSVVKNDIGIQPNK
jgi:hypothetical protein